MSLLAEPTDTHYPRLAGMPEIVVIVPIYGHPVLLSEAIESVLAQQCAARIGIVIVSDGCRMPETDLIASAYALAHANVVYLRKANGGPSSARNYGIDYALRSWPTMQALFFLDSDNRLTPAALADAYDVLIGTEGLGWVYPNIDSFGISWSANYGVPYSPLLHIVYDNICDTGSLVARAVVEAGVRFDEDAKSGYEDWDFWLQCLDRGFTGRHAPFGFTYRQRPESRYREMNRQRGAMVEHLRRRHWAIARPNNLLRWEHESNPRFLLTTDKGASFAFTDPVDTGQPIDRDGLIEQFYAALQHPDEALLWPFLVFGSAATLATLLRLKLLHGIFALMEREAAKVGFVAVTLSQTAGEIALEIGSPADPVSLHARALLWICRGQQFREIVQDDGDSWVRSLATTAPQPEITEIGIAAPLDTGDAPFDWAATEALMGLITAFRASPMRGKARPRWIWRARHFPAREHYYRHVCTYLGVSALMPRLAGRQTEVGIVVPIASYGGAEKVAYAMARYLRVTGGARVHLFVLGKPAMKVISEYDEAFDTINFLADPAFPMWGGPMTILGQECFLPDSPEVKTPDIAGLLVNLDFVVNCHSAPLNSIMGTLRAQQRAKTATYLHVFDSTRLKRPVGHPYLTVAFEHAYDLVLTCSRQLGEEVHALGVPSSKIMPIANAAGFTVGPEITEAQRAWRATPRGNRKLRALYLGRLDRQKGVERLIGTVERVGNEDLPVEFRVIGSGLLESGDSWSTALQRLGVSVELPITASEALAAIYGWADVLLLPSRWEGAPLVIPECHQLGCIPIATRVGAVEELTTHGLDGLLVESVNDAATAAAMAALIAELCRDDAWRRDLAEAGLRRAETNQWEHNFAPLGAWMAQMFADKA